MKLILPQGDCSSTLRDFLSEYSDKHNLVIEGQGAGLDVAYPVYQELGEDGTPVATIALSGTPRAQFGQIITGMTGLANWSVEMYYSQARCDSALKAGAAFAYGAFREPASGAPRAHRLVWSLWNGLNMAEWIQGEQTMESGTLNLLGDPLYQPFGHRYA